MTRILLSQADTFYKTCVFARLKIGGCGYQVLSPRSYRVVTTTSFKAFLAPRGHSENTFRC